MGRRTTKLLGVIAPMILAQPGGNGGMGGGGNPHFECPDAGGSPFAGDSDYIGKGLKPIPVRGNVGCVDASPLATRPTVENRRGGTRPATNIYGPMEAGFTSENHECLGDVVVPAGMDTRLAEAMLHAIDGCEGREILDFCGGHATPYHYHEKMSCLYEDDATTGHSTRIGTALDGHGLYGKHVDGGVEPDDLDACGGRVGVTPDSGGEPVYYYTLTDAPPFTMGCFGDETTYPVTVDQCRSLYDACQDEPVVIETIHGSGPFTLECPCWDARGSNVEGQEGTPCFLASEGNCTGALSTSGGAGRVVSRAMVGCLAAAAVLFV